jgi:hypothetical protein
MSAGRPKDQPFDPEEKESVRQVVVSLDERGRIKLPVRITESLSWLADRDTLAVLSTPGIIRLYPWTPAGEAVLRRRRELLERTKDEPSTYEILRALEDRYKRLKIPKSVRPTLTNEMILHLGLAPYVSTSVYLWRIADTVEINSSPHRTQHLADEWEELSDLP